MKRLVSSLLVAVGLAFATVPAQAADRLQVALDWFVNPDHAPLIIAREKGFFAKAGLDVTLIPPADPAAPPRLLAAGQVDIAISYQPSLHLAVHEGLPLVRFGTLVETPLNTVVVLADGPVKSLADLKGRKVGYSVSGFEDALLGQMLEGAGIALKDVQLVNVNFALTAALLSGQVDAVVGGYRNFELTEIELHGRKGRAFYPEEHGVPAYDELVYLARRDRAHDPRLGRFMQAVEQATLWLTNNPAEAWEIFRKTDGKLDDELNRRAFADTLPRFAKRPAALDVGRYERFAAFLKARKLIDSVPPIESYAVVPRQGS